MKILVTGGAGFIGSHVVETLLENGHSVTVVDNLSTGKLENLWHLPLIHHYNGRFVFRKQPVTEYYDFEKFDFIYHLAATVGVNRVLENPAQCVVNNLDSLRAVLQLKTPGLFTSTSEVYGKNTDDLLREDSELIYTSKNRWSYATSKLIGEWFALQAGWKVVRLFNVVGPRQSGSYGAVLPAFVRQALKSEPMTIFGTGKQTRTFINVKDCVSILYELMDKDFDVVNVGGVDSMSILGLSKIVADVLDHGYRASKLVPYEEAYKGQFEDCMNRIPDLTKLFSLIKQREFIPIEETVRQIADYLRGEETCRITNQVTASVLS